LWTSAHSSFGVVVMIVKLRIVSWAEERQVSNNPASAMMLRSASAMAQGCFSFGPIFFHS